MGNAPKVASDAVLLRKWLNIPDGVIFSADRKWLAVSNHNTHGVFIYENAVSLDAQSDPVGILRQVYYPHGLCFSPDGRLLFVADAGSPHLLVYASDACEWRGVRNPVGTFRIMDDATFARGHTNLQEGGPKGIDIREDAGVLVATSEFQPLAFFDLAQVRAIADGGSREGDLLAAGSREAGGGGPDIPVLRERRAAEIRYELHVIAQANAALDAMSDSLSWRITAPLRGLVQSARLGARQLLKRKRGRE
jgi:DNA-binding beta-propeller fold protein YncE